MCPAPKVAPGEGGEWSLCVCVCVGLRRPEELQKMQPSFKLNESAIEFGEKKKKELCDPTQELVPATRALGNEIER